MTKKVMRFWCAIVFLSLWAATSAPAADDDAESIIGKLVKSIPPGESLIPAGATVEKPPRPAKPRSVGKIVFVQGVAYVVDALDRTVFEAAKNMSLYEGDSLVTGKGGSIRAQIGDKSAFSLAEYSRLAIEKSGGAGQDTVLGLGQGRGRFKVKKLEGPGEQFKVNSPCSVAGVRGSDFGFISLLGGNGVCESALVTGDDTVVEFGDRTGAGVVAPAYFVTLTGTGKPPLKPIFVGREKALGALDHIAPAIAIMWMP